jgi:hypothetical protein
MVVLAKGKGGCPSDASSAMRPSCRGRLTDDCARNHVVIMSPAHVPARGCTDACGVWCLCVVFVWRGRRIYAHGTGRTCAGSCRCEAAKAHLTRALCNPSMIPASLSPALICPPMFPARGSLAEAYVSSGMSLPLRLGHVPCVAPAAPFVHVSAPWPWNISLRSAPSGAICSPLRHSRDPGSTII